LFGKKSSNINYLELTPLTAKEFTYENGFVTILIPKFKNALFKSMIPKKKSPYIKIKLDELGSGVWIAIDGIKKVENIVTELSEQFGEKIHPAEERIIKYLSELYGHKFIGFKELQKV